ncbi:MAG: hypothetical protein FWD68_00875 [Alphaproteobacteria bacterium]|nr:hypothetical protein [Alphaproteobacteria bacterium]
MTDLVVLQEWEGYVTDIHAETFTARLLDITTGDTVEGEEADFRITDLQDDDRPLVKEGTVFRWVIACRRAPDGTKQTVSKVAFRRLPIWTEEDLTAAELKGGGTPESRRLGLTARVDFRDFRAAPVVQLTETASAAALVRSSSPGETNSTSRQRTAMAHSNMKQLAQNPVSTKSQPKAQGNSAAPNPPIIPTSPAAVPTRAG